MPLQYQTNHYIQALRQQREGAADQCAQLLAVIENQALQLADANRIITELEAQLPQTETPAATDAVAAETETATR